VVAVVAAVYLGPQMLELMAATPAAATAAEVAAAKVLTVATANVISQSVGIAVGVQEKFSWKQVALSAVSAGVSGGLESVNFTGGGLDSMGNIIARAAAGNAISQGIGVASGLQKSFDWRGVAASAAGAGVAQAVSGPIGDALGKGTFGARLATGLVAGTAVAVARGGKIAIQQVVIDAFGNVLGSSLAGAMSGPSQQGVALPETGVSELTKRGQAALDQLEAAAQAHGGYDRIPGNAAELKNAYDTAMTNNNVIFGLAKEGDSGLGFADTVTLAGAGESWKANVQSAIRQGARDLAVGGGVVTGMLQGIGDTAIGAGALVKDLLLAQQYMLGGGDNWANRNLLPGFAMKQEAYQSLQALRGAVGEIVSDPKRYLGDMVGNSYDKVTNALVTAQRTEDLNDWFFYGAAVGNVTLGVASVVAGAGGAARLASAGARDLSILLRTRIYDLAPDVRVSPFAPELSRGVAGLELPKPAQVRINKYDGDAWEADLVDNHLPLTQKDIRRQISVRSYGPSGLTVRLDALGTDAAEGALRMTDAKGSLTAPLTPNQVLVYPELELFGGIVIGKGKAPYIGGTQIPPSLVDIIRKKP
jgi:hypothetical protein